MTQLNENVDVVVIGGGVVGCAVFRRFTLMGANALLLEKGGDILSGASKANSAILHTGFDAPTGSLELKCMQDGYKEYMEIRDKMNLPLLKTTAIVVAWNQEQLDALPGIVRQAHANGVADVIQISEKEVYHREPNLAPGALGGVFVPGEYVIDPWSSPLAYVTQAVMHGGRYEFNCQVLNVQLESDGWELTTNKGTVRTRLVINCAGNHGDLIDGMWRTPEFEIRPRKGQFLVYDKASASQINAIILPVPTATTKGVLLCKTIFGNMILGPTAEEQQDRNRADVDESMMNELIDKGSRMLPSLTHYSVTRNLCRAASCHREKRVPHFPLSTGKMDYGGGNSLKRG
ncbi:FAD dependent oxidoreductase [Klebsiella variicola]|nr:FAD dependent oxidoreductase [Klebsiella variicola]